MTVRLQTVNVGPLAPDSVQTASLDQTDPLLGVRTIGFLLSNELDTEATVQSAEGAASRFSVSGAGGATLQRLDGTTLLSTGVNGGSAATLAAGASLVVGGVGRASTTGGAVQSFDDPNSLYGMLLGTGTTSVQVSAAPASVFVQGPGNFTAVIGTHVTAQLVAAVAINTGVGSSTTTGTWARQSNPPTGITGAMTPTVAGTPGASSYAPGTLTIKQQRTIADATTGWTSNLAFNGFDQSLGTLESVTVQVVADAVGTVSAENLDPVTSALTVAQAATVSVLRPDGTAYAQDVSDLSFTAQLRAFDGVSDDAGVSGVSGASSTVATTPAPSIDYNQPADMASFIGVGPINLSVVSQGTAAVQGPGDLAVTSALRAGATVTLVYNYLAGGPSNMSFTSTDDQPPPTTDASGVTLIDGGTFDLPNVSFVQGISATLDANGTLQVASSGGAGAINVGAAPELMASDVLLDADAAGTGTSVTLDVGAISVAGDTQDAHQAYIGPVDGLDFEYAAIHSDSVVAVANTDNWFLHGTDGEDALTAHGGRNVLDGGAGSNFLVGGTGTDTFFVDVVAGATTWSTVAQAHAGDDVTVWDVDSTNMSIEDGAGAAGYTGLTLRFANPSSQGLTSLTLSGYTSSDIAAASGKLLLSNGNVGGHDYFHIGMTG